MKYIFIVSLLIVFVFAFSPGKYTPAYIVDHDKIAHAMAFFMLSFFLHRTFPIWKMQTVMLLMFLFGLTLEMVQFLFTSRGFSLKDLMYDVVGMIIYMSVHLGFKRIAPFFRDTQEKS